MGKSVKINFYVAPSFLDRIDKLKEAAGFTTRASLFRRAVRLFGVLWRAAERDALIIIREADGRELLVELIGPD